jgi:hypothetical protein
VAEFFLPPFDSSEIQLCRELCFPLLDELGVSRSFDIWGGSARLVLRQHVKTSTPAFLRELAASLTFDVLESTIHDLASAGSASAEMSQRVVHMVPDDDSLRSFHLRFASRRMSDIFYSLLQSAGEERIRRFIASSEASPSMGALRGQVFERLALSILSRAGRASAIELSEIGRGTSSDELLIDRDVLLFDHISFAVNKVRQCQRAGEVPPLCRPRAANFPTWDAAAIDAGGCLRLYLATVSDSHDINAKGLQLAEGLDSLSHGPVRFFFVVPPGRGPSKALHHEKLPRWLAERTMVQYVLEVALIPDAII